MDNNRTRLIRYSGLGLIITALGLLTVNIFFKPAVNLSLPLVFLMLAGASFSLVSILRSRWRWAPLFYMPGSMMLAFGLIFLLSVLTGDWNAWAYAWLLLVAGLGAGLALAARALGWGQRITIAGLGTALGGVTLSALFGAIAGGPFLQIMAPVLLGLGGLALYRFGPASWLAKDTSSQANATQPFPAQTTLAEPLSTREIEVLRLIDQGLTNAEIASRLTIAQSTVKTHINNIYGKLDVETRTQALKRARDIGLI